MTRIFRAICILVAHAALLVLGAPGLDFLPESYLQTERAQQAMVKRHGETKTQLAIAAANLNRHRLKVEDSLGGVQPIFRVAQSWHLYRDGPRQTRKVEVRIDGDVVYRTLDPTLRWMEPVLRNRRIRPMVESMASKPKAGNRRGLGRFIVERAREDFPDAKRVEIVSLSGKRPGATLKAHHRMTAQAPLWTLEDAP